jgi:hypothetical protein
VETKIPSVSAGAAYSGIPATSVPAERLFSPAAVPLSLTPAMQCHRIVTHGPALDPFMSPIQANFHLRQILHTATKS